MSKGGFFSIDSPLYRFLSRLMDMLKLNFMWLLCGGVVLKFAIDYILALLNLQTFRFLGFVPLIFMGAATTAAFSITLKMIDDEEGYIARPFLREFRANIKQGSITGTVQLVAMYAIYLDYQIYTATENMLFLVVGAIAVFLTYMHFIYAYPLISRYENTIINTLRNSYTISIRYFKKSIGLFLILALECVVFMWNNTTLLIGVIIGPACIILTISGFVKPLFKKIENDNAERENGGLAEIEEENDETIDE